MVLLTRREREILRLVVDGCTNRQISQRLGTRPLTVKNQIAALLEKVQLRNRLQLAVWAVRQGVLDG